MRVDTDAEVRFEGVPVGPFRGREEIRAAYESRPPDDEVDVRNVRSEGDRTVADYGWAAEQGVRAGSQAQHVLAVGPIRVGDETSLSAAASAILAWSGPI